MANRLYGRTSAELREQVLEWHFRPVCRALFRRDPEVQSVLFLVAQYWDDNANDATHSMLWPSYSSDPQWPAEAETDDRWGENPPKKWQSLSAAVSDVTGDEYAWLDDNNSLIVAFSSFCKEGGDQNKDYGENYTPYAIARRFPRQRPGEEPPPLLDIDVQIVGTMLKPWAEDNWNVGYWNIDRDPIDAPLPEDAVLEVPGLPQISIEDLLRALDERAAFRTELEGYRALLEPLLKGSITPASLPAIEALRRAVNR